MKKHSEDQLFDVFAGYVELTAPELAYVRFALEELYRSGKYPFVDGYSNRREFSIRVGSRLLNKLKLDKMVTPDGLRLVSVAEHEEIVRAIEEAKRNAEALRDKEEFERSG